MIVQPDHTKASIREVYDIVSRLEDKFIEALHESESRILESIEDRDRVRRSDIARLGGEVDDLKAWRESLIVSSVAEEAKHAGKVWPIVFLREIAEDYWKIIVILIAILAFLITDLHVEIH
jgi:hypothetical protein